LHGGIKAPVQVGIAMVTSPAVSASDLMCDWVARYDPADVSVESRAIAREITTDALACAVSSCREPVVRLIKEALVSSGGAGESFVIADPVRRGLADAVLINGTMTRAQDYNDAYVRGGAVGHPSDNVAPLLTVAEQADISGRRFLDAMILVSETYCRLIDYSEPGSGWDHSALTAVALPIGIAWMLEMDRDATRAAVALAATFARPSSEVRHGELSPAKSMANAAVASAACTFALMARAGITGPSGGLDGAAGWLQTVGAGVDAEAVFGTAIDRCRLDDVSIKAFPAIGTSQGPIAAALEARPRFLELEPVLETLDLRVDLPYSSLKATQVNDPDRWQPSTKETADHSIPYLVAAALVEGRIDAEQFDRRIWEQPRVRAVMDKLTLSLEENSTLGLTGARLTITSPSGVEAFEVEHAPGDPLNPIRGKKLQERVTRSMRVAWGESECKEILTWLEVIDQQSTVRSLASLLARGVDT
jgi:2-methylcitrate dehydratase